MSEKRQRLKRQADALYNEWSEAKSNLEQKASSSVKKILVMVAIGYSLIYVYRLINAKDEDEKVEINNKKSLRAPMFTSSRLTGALKTLFLPLLIKIVKREILEATESKNE